MSTLEDLHTLVALISTGPPGFAIQPNSEHSAILGNALRELADAEETVKRAMTALEFYGNPANHEPLPIPTTVSEDGGAIARRTLAIIRGA